MTEVTLQGRHWKLWGRMVGGSEFYFRNINITTGKEWASQMAQQVKNLPAVKETQKMRVRSLGQEDPLEKEMSTHSSILAWEIPWTEEPGGLQSMGSLRVGQNWETKHTLCRPRMDRSDSLLSEE